jgi:DNA processing protein
VSRRAPPQRAAEEEQIDRLRLARTEGVGPITYRKLMARFGTASAAIAGLPALAEAGGRGAPLVVAEPGAARRELDSLARMHARAVFIGDADYPPLLALLDDPPPVLAVLGGMDAFASRAVAIVGSRNASVNGRRMAESLAADLAGAGIAVVSGLARGIDAAAHLGALAGGGRTVACVAGGLDVPYPPEHAPLQARIAAEGGAVVSEAPLGTAPQSRHFPRRNRVIAGLSLGVVVVEAAPRSGSLTTARLAQDAHRELFAVPGSPLDPRCRGSNGLIRDGAHLTEDAADVLQHLPDHPGRTGLSRLPLFARGPSLPAGLEEPAEAVATAVEIDPPTLGRAREEVISLLGPEATAIDDLLRRCQFSAPAVMSVLLELELAGRVEALPGGRVALLMEPGAATPR